VLIAILKEGDIFGEMALLEAKPRAASAIAYENCKVLAVNRQNFEQMISTQPQMVARLTTLLSERVWFMYKQLANTLVQDPIARMYDMLTLQLARNRVNVKEPLPYYFNFGPRELATMVGVPHEKVVPLFEQMMKTSRLRIVNDKLQIDNVMDIVKQNDLFHKIQHIEDSRR
jgi:CRP-like cAMP-binding protein